MKRNKHIQKYMRNLRLCFPYYGKTETIFLHRLKKSMEEYVSDFPNSTYTALITQFGHPKDVAINYFYEKDNLSLAKQLHLHKIICYLCFIVIFVAILYSSWKTVDLYSGYKEGIETQIFYDTEQITIYK